MNKPTLFRKRLIPQECVCLKNDELLYLDSEVIVTRWNALHPKVDLHHGMSCYFMSKGIKVSKFCQSDGSIMYWYCDIIESAYDSLRNEYIFTDLLADVVIYPDGTVHVADLDELAFAMENGIITDLQLITSLRALDRLLQIIYRGEFDELKKWIETYEKAEPSI